MNPKSGGDLTRRRFLRRLALFAFLASGSRYGAYLWADEPSSDPFGQTLPRRSLGRTGEKVTMLGLGGFHVGSLSDRDAQAMIEASIDGGIRFFDTAQQYQNGGSEAKYGRFLTPKYRDHIFLMTKTVARDSSAARRDLEESLRRFSIFAKCIALIHRETWSNANVMVLCKPWKKRSEAAKCGTSDLPDTGRQALTGASWK
jgi:hypothetical protein